MTDSVRMIIFWEATLANPIDPILPTELWPSFEAALASLRFLPEDMTRLLDAAIVLDDDAICVWLRFYATRVGGRVGIESIRPTISFAELVAKADVESMLPILFVCSHLLLRYLLISGRGDAVLDILSKVRHCCTTLMLEWADRVDNVNGRPFESLLALALLHSQLREHTYTNKEHLSGSRRPRTEQLHSALATKFTILSERIQDRNRMEEIGHFRNGSAISFSQFLEDVFKELYLPPDEGGLSYRVDIPCSESETQSFCTGDYVEDRHGLSDEETSQCYCNLVSGLISEELLALFGYARMTLREQLHEQLLRMECVDGTSWAIELRWSGAALLKDPGKEADDGWAVVGVFSESLLNWIRVFSHWFHAQWTVNESSMGMNEGCRRSILARSIVAALEDLQVFGQYLSISPDVHTSSKGFIEWRNAQESWKRLRDGFWNDIWRLLCYGPYSSGRQCRRYRRARRHQ